MYANMVEPQITKILEQRFVALWSRCLKGQEDPTPPWDVLERNYTSQGRYYHCLGHLVHCLGQFDPVVSKIDDPNAVEMSIWFHDVVLERGAKDNELRSAELFEHHAEGIFETAFIKKVFDLIIVTDHRSEPKTSDQGWMTDIDLSSFGLSWPEYLRDTLALRKENQNLPDDLYHAGHRRFLENLLARPRIFHSDFFFQQYEGEARKNIQHYLAFLDQYGRVPGPKDAPEAAI